MGWIQNKLQSLRSSHKRLAFARGLSELGNSFRYVALPLAIFGIRRDPTDLAWAEILETLGFFSSGLLSPFYVDRSNKLRNLLWADLFSGTIVFVILWAIYLGSLPALLTASFLMTFIGTFYSSCLSAATADLSRDKDDQEKLLYGLSYLQLCILAGGFIGTLLSIVLVEKWPLYALLSLDFVSFVLSSIWIYRVLRQETRADRPVPLQKRPEKAAIFKEYREGFQHIWTSPTLCKLVLAQAFVGMAYGLSTSAIISFYKQKLHFNNKMVAVAQLNNRFTALVGALVRLNRKVHLIQIFFLSGFVMSLGYLGIYMSKAFWVLLFYGLVNFAMSLKTPTNLACVLQVTPQNVRGRVASARNFFVDIGVLAGNFLGLFLIKSLGVQYPFLLASVVAFIPVLIYARISVWPDLK